MKCNNQNQRSGAIIIYAALALFLMLIMAAISIDVAYMQLVRTELRTATDAASIAGAEALGRLQSRVAAVAAAKDAASLNLVARQPLVLNDVDVQIGRSEQDATGSFVFAEAPLSSRRVNSVRVDGRRDETSQLGRVQLFMGGVLDTEFFAPRQQATSTSTVRDIALVLDRSGSMKGKKLEDLKNSVAVFFEILGALPTNSVQCSLTSYAADVTLDEPLTGDFAALNVAAQGILASGLTNIGDALRGGASSIVPLDDGGTGANARRFADRAVVLLTDGRNTAGNPPFAIPPGGTISAVEFCVRNNIPVFTISFGANANRQEMEQIAAETGGFFRNANNGADLQEAFREIAARIAVTLVQ